MSEVAKLSRKYGLICGAGSEPLTIAKILSKKHVSVFIIKLYGEADADYSEFEHIELKIGQLEKMAKYLADAGCTEIVFREKTTVNCHKVTLPVFPIERFSYAR